MGYSNKLHTHTHHSLLNILLPALCVEKPDTNDLEVEILVTVLFKVV